MARDSAHSRVNDAEAGSSAVDGLNSQRRLHAKLQDLWTDVSKPSGFTSLNQLYKAARGIKGATKKRVREWLQTQPSYNRFKSRRRRFKRRQMIAYSIDEVWGSDLIDVQNLSRYNGNTKFILLCVDHLSGFVFLEPMRNKSAEETTRALETVFTSSGRSPKMLLTDRGMEYWNRKLMSLLERRGILLMSTENSQMKSAVAERMVRTVKSRISKLLEHSKSLKYIDRLPDIALSINSSRGRITRLSPDEIVRENKGSIAFERRYGPRLQTDRAYSFSLSPGDTVRIALPIETFSKEGRPSFSRELYRVEEAVPSHPHTFKIALLDSKGDSLGTLLRGFYSPELSKVVDPVFSLEDLSKRSIPRRKRRI